MESLALSQSAPQLSETPEDEAHNARFDVEKDALNPRLPLVDAVAEMVRGRSGGCYYPLRQSSISSDSEEVNEALKLALEKDIPRLIELGVFRQVDTSPYRENVDGRAIFEGFATYPLLTPLGDLEATDHPYKRMDLDIIEAYHATVVVEARGEFTEAAGKEETVTPCKRRKTGLLLMNDHMLSPEKNSKEPVVISDDEDKGFLDDLERDLGGDPGLISDDEDKSFLGDLERDLGGGLLSEDQGPIIIDE